MKAEGIPLPSQIRSLISSGGPSLILRLASAGAKFLLVVVLARVTTPAQVGVFGLFVAGVTTAVYAVGLEYHVFNTREIIRVPRARRSEVLRDQVVFGSLAYLAIAPLVAAIFVLGLLPLRLAGWFVAIFLVEHVSLELYRLLVALHRPSLAHIVFFVRSGSWVYVWIGIMSVAPGARDLETVWLLWLGGGALSVILGLVFVSRIVPMSPPLTVDVDRIKRGVKVAMPYLGASLALRVMLTVDRYVLEAYRDATAVGVYTLFIGVAGLVLIMVESAVIAIMFPPIIAAYQSDELEHYRRLVKRFRDAVVATAIVGAIVAAAGIVPVLRVLNRPVYQDNLLVYWVLLGASVVGAVGLVPHYQLYARGHDWDVFRTALVGLGVAVIGHLLLVRPLGALGSATSTLLGYTGTAVAGSLALHRKTTTKPMR